MIVGTLKIYETTLGFARSKLRIKLPPQLAGTCASVPEYRRGGLFLV